MADSRPTLLLVHGAWMHSWVWDGVTPILAQDGWQVRLVDLPTTASQGAGNFGLYDDAALVSDCIAAIDTSVVVVGHSYGGAVVSEAAADHANVAHLVYVCAFQLDAGESLLAAAGGTPLPWWVIDGNQMTVSEPMRLFFNDIAVDDAERASMRLQPFSYPAVTQPLTRAAWRTVPSTYVICERDTAFGQGQDVFAARASEVRRLPSGHSPFLSVPTELAHTIAEAAMTR
ncbi:alpha/beta fold hydrolase [Mycobacterium asiaticum]|nr:alpha/beta hydrolase [Mycobacterium asiaticum]